MGSFEFLGGAVVLAFAAVFYLAWHTDTSGHGERGFLLLPVVGLAPFGAGAILCGIALRFHWPGGRWYALAPFVFTAAAIWTCWMMLF
jgi:hypothetical protein